MRTDPELIRELDREIARLERLGRLARESGFAELAAKLDSDLAAVRPIRRRFGTVSKSSE
jgi:hypothetical protein